MNDHDDTAPIRVAVCGSRFGARYAEALSADPDVELVGLLGRGSERTRALARRLDVPWTDEIDRLPRIEAACVVVGTGLAGGNGTALSRKFLSRGIAVLQEHPVPDSELAETIALARHHRTAYRVSSLHPELPAPRRIIEASRALGRPLFVDAVCAIPMTYVFLDILYSALKGLRPFECLAATIPQALRELSAVPAAYRMVQGVAGGVPLTLRVQNELHETDPESYMHIPLRITAGFPGGVLTLTDLNGPVLWTARPHTTVEIDGPGNAPLGPSDGPTLAEAARTIWPSGIRTSVQALRDDINQQRDPMRSCRRHLTVAKAWQQLYEALGYPDVVSAEIPRPVAADEVDAAARTDAPLQARPAPVTESRIAPAHTSDFRRDK